MKRLIILLIITVTGCTTAVQQKVQLDADQRAAKERRALAIAAYKEAEDNDKKYKATLRAQGYIICENKGAGIVACK